MKISDKGLELIMNFEGFRANAYKPVKEETYWTIGFGHYGPDVKKGDTITRERAVELLKEDMVGYERTVENVCNYLTLNQNEFDALVSFTYNCGGGGLLQLTKNKSRTKAQMMEHIEAYTKGANGKSLPGLVKRRKMEKELFLTPVEEVKEDDDMKEPEIYRTIEDVPDWAVSSIKKAITAGILKGESDEYLGLTRTETKVLVWLDRCGEFDKFLK